MGHTPGPWKARIYGGSTFWGCSAPRIMYGDRTIASANHFLTHIDGRRLEDEEVESNALLMAAAPDLLEVCTEVAMEPYPDSDLASLLETLRARAKAAIAKAQPNNHNAADR